MLMIRPIPQALWVAALAGLLLVAGCSAAATPSPSASAIPTPSPTSEPTASPTVEPTATPLPTASPVPTPIAAQQLTVELSVTSARGTIEGPGRCDIGLNETSLYLEHRQAGTLDLYITLGPAQGGISGPGLTPGGGSYGAEAVRIRVVDPSIGSFLDAVDPEMVVAPGLKSGMFSGTWKGEPLSGTYTCG